MKQTISEYQFIDEFKSLRPDNFSYEGLKALYDWFEQYEEDTGEDIELDVIAICCDFGEYTSDEIKAYYDYMLDVGDDTDMHDIIQQLNDHTIVIPVSDDIVIIQSF